MNIFKKIQATLRLYEAVRQADKAHRESGKRYYVMPTSGTSGQLVIMDRSNFRKLKQKHYINYNTFVRDLEIWCFYCTPYNNGTGKLSSAVMVLKRKQYYLWLDSLKK